MGERMTTLETQSLVDMKVGVTHLQPAKFPVLPVTTRVSVHAPFQAFRRQLHLGLPPEDEQLRGLDNVEQFLQPALSITRP
jgi:hypothetical protein